MANWTQKQMLMTIGGVAFVVCAAAGGGVYYTQGLIEDQHATEQKKTSGNYCMGAWAQ